MKSCLFVLLNYVFQNDLELLFGKNSFVDVLSVKFCTTKKSFLVDVKLYISDIELFSESGIKSLDYLIYECWKYTGNETKDIIIISCYDLFENHSSK